MSLYVKSSRVGELAQKLAIARGVTKTEAVHDALLDALEKAGACRPPSDAVTKVRQLIDDLRRRYPPTGLKADKAFIDGLYED